MTAVEKSKLIQVPVEPCYTGLLRALKNLGVQIVSSDAEKRTVVARWSGGVGVKFTVQIECIPQGEEATNVHILYRRDLTPAMSRPMGAIPPAEYDTKVDLILNSTVNAAKSPELNSEEQRYLEMKLAAQKGGMRNRLLILVALGILTGVLIGFMGGGFNIFGFFIAAASSFFIYSIIARIFFPQN